MKTIGLFITCLFVLAGGFLLGREFPRNPPKQAEVASVAPEAKPGIDWTKFFDRVFHAEWQITFEIGLTTDDFTKCEYTLYLVDGDRWIELESERGVKGCGAPQSVYRFFVMLPEDFTNKLTRVPGKDAKIVAVGIGNPKVVEQGVRYFNTKTRKEEKND